MARKQQLQRLGALQERRRAQEPIISILYVSCIESYVLVASKHLGTVDVYT